MQGFEGCPGKPDTEGLGVSKTKDIVAAARELVEIAGSEWLHDQRAEAKRSEAEAYNAEQSAKRKARLNAIKTKVGRIHEIDAQMELLLTLPESESGYVQPLLGHLRQIRADLARTKNLPIG
jgi:hypothetical protein